MLKSVPVRWRLTVWSAALLVILLAVFGTGVYLGLRTMLYDNFQEQVRSQAELALAAIQIQNGQLILDPESRTALENNEHFVRVTQSDGSVSFDTSSDLGPFPVDAGIIRTALNGASTFSTWNTDEGTIVFVTVPIRDDGSIVGVLQTGASRADIDETLRLLMTSMLVAVPVMLVLALVGGYLLAGRALRPVAHITNLASTIDEHDLHSRLDLRLPDDELGRLARTIDAMLERIENAFERQRQFTGDAAHELRTPLSLMRTQVDLARSRDRDADDYREAFAELDQDLARMTRLVETLLMLARSDRAVLTPDCSAFDLADVIDSVCDQYEDQIRSSGINLTRETEPAELVADEDLLIQVLVNLLDNAILHVHAGDAISVGCRASSNSVRIWVSDTGSGIPREDQPRVFDRFYRVDTGRTRDFGGTGLGLAICNAIVDAHHGSIHLESEVDVGTTISIDLPSGTGHIRHKTSS